MIKVGGELIEFTSFPDSTTSFRYEPDRHQRDFDIVWQYDGDHECVLLWYLVNHIRSICPDANVELYLPYIPNARMDRVKANDEVFTLKWFANFINTLKFSKVAVLDPHSNVSTALIDHVMNVPVKTLVELTLGKIRDHNPKPVILCYPDEGAAKRYSGMFSGEDYVFCIKDRDWRSGKILGLNLNNAEKVYGKDVLIVDDICSRGGTFTHTAVSLKAAGAEEIFLYVTHCENTIREGSVLTDGLISRVYTTDSIFRGEHEKIKTYPV